MKHQQDQTMMTRAVIVLGVAWGAGAAVGASRVGLPGVKICIECLPGNNGDICDFTVCAADQGCLVLGVDDEGDGRFEDIDVACIGGR